MMKKLVYSLVGAALITFASCGNKSTIGKSINVPCSGSKYSSDKKHFRAAGIGESMDLMTSVKKAESSAKARLAGYIQSTMKVVGDNYVNSTEFNNKEEITETFQENARTVVDQVLAGVKVICEEKTVVEQKGQNNKYATYMAIEVASDDIVSALNSKLSKDEKLKAMYNYEKFQETFDKEMSKMEDK